MDLVEFLNARLDEDEQTARAATDGPWTIRSLGRHDLSTVVMGNELLAQLDGSRAASNSVHMAVHNPARVLAEVDAKRRIVELHGIVHRNIGWLEDGFEEGGEVAVCGLCVPRHSGFRTRAEVPEGPCPTLRLLALPYADHADYDEAWRP